MKTFISTLFILLLTTLPTTDKKNLWIKTTHINETFNYIISENNFIESFTDNDSKLLKQLTTLYGTHTTMYTHINGIRKSIGYVFTKKSNLPYKHTVWIEIL